MKNFNNIDMYIYINIHMKNEYMNELDIIMRTYIYMKICNVHLVNLKIHLIVHRNIQMNVLRLISM